MVDKRKESKELAELVDAWNIGVKVEIPIDKFRSKYEFDHLPSGHRCMICDWCPTDDRSIFNPMIAEYGSNRIEIDDLTGDMLCRYCLSASEGMSKVSASDSGYDVLMEGREVIPGGYRKKPIRYDE